ncbi:Transcription factor ILR3 [Heracleum sosnowskyi]|uniref:Transcription factor ILR3 n=1 Tax=Heracleum sosnowskyi TaxID=360622 RepID=A0AAD8H705_9APIA|nr:Transcription factor ILR3 [Heracleum sosnowskyi]
MIVSPENTNWLYGLLDDISVPDPNYAVEASAWTNINASSNMSVSGSNSDLGVIKEAGSKKRVRSETCNGSSTKACREKMRRDKLNDKFMELGAILDPGRPVKTDKAAILIDATRMVIQLRSESQKLKDTNTDLQQKVKELKTEKNELREEKQRLKIEKDRLENQLKTMTAQPSFLHPPSAPIPALYPQAPYAAQAPVAGNKYVPIISYPGVAMWQFMPPASVDTSQDHMLRPPVA